MELECFTGIKALNQIGYPEIFVLLKKIRRMISREDILTYLTENKPMFQQRFHLMKLGLFGSFARQEAGETSDLDILIELEPGTSDIFEIKQELRSTLEKQFQRKVDICREKAILPIFRPMILDEVIYV
jgi:predicted nucleotidyltransferase